MLKLKTLTALQTLSNLYLNVTENPLKKSEGVIVNFYLRFSCLFRKAFCLFVLNSYIAFCLLSHICNLPRIMTFSKSNFRYDLSNIACEQATKTKKNQALRSVLPARQFFFSPYTPFHRLEYCNAIDKKEI